MGGGGGLANLFGQEAVCFEQVLLDSVPMRCAATICCSGRKEWSKYMLFRRVGSRCSRLSLDWRRVVSQREHEASYLQVVQRKAFSLSSCLYDCSVHSCFIPILYPI